MIVPAGRRAAAGKAAPLAKHQLGCNAAFGAANSLHFGTKVNSCFTIVAPRRYAFDMLPFAVALSAAASAPQGASFTRVGATVQAQAIVRIVTAASLRLGEGPLRGDAPPARRTTVHTDGEVHSAKLIEFQ
jgi:hypothetical protein